MIEAPLTHCGACGQPGLQFDGFKALRCEACGWIYYANPACAAAALLFESGQLLMVRRGRDPGKGLLDLPGGFVDPGENAEAALRRELQEELRLSVPAVEYVGSYANTYRYGGVLYQIVDLVFQANLSRRPEWFEADELAGLEWIDPPGIDPAQIAFDSVRQCLADRFG